MACDKTVYLVDKLTADNRVYHKACFRCHHCKGTLKVCISGWGPGDQGGFLILPSLHILCSVKELFSVSFLLSFFFYEEW
jgi:hypothetical protein